MSYQAGNHDRPEDTANKVPLTTSARDHALFGHGGRKHGGHGPRLIGRFRLIALNGVP